MSPQWTDVTSVLDLAPVGLVGSVRCGDAEHGLAWTGSGLHAVGHDPTEEDILDALGGRRPRCVQLATTWEEYKLEPLLIGALLTGRVGLLSRQSHATVGPPVAGPLGSFALARLVQPFLDFPPGLRRVLAADAALAYSRTELVRRGVPDDTTELRTSLRRLVTAAAEDAFDRPVEVRLTVTSDGPRPANLVRERGSPLVLAGQLPVSWAALAALGLAARPGLLMTEVELDGAVVRSRGYAFGPRDADLVATHDERPLGIVRDDVRSLLAS